VFYTVLVGNRDIVIIDARNKASYDKLHIRDAINIDMHNGKVTNTNLNSNCNRAARSREGRERAGH